MSLDELTRLVPPPKPVPRFDFGAVETAVGFALPDDYKQLISTYGRGSFGGYLGLMAPTRDDLIDGGAYCRQSLADLRDTYSDHSWIYPDGTKAPMVIEDVEPVPYYGWGGAPGGETGYWHMSGGSPDDWAAVAIADGWTNDYHPGGLVAYLTDLIAGRFPPRCSATRRSSTCADRLCPARLRNGGRTRQWGFVILLPHVKMRAKADSLPHVSVRAC